MKALTIRQPWAGAIAYGAKRTENRSWPAPSKHLGTRVLIHAAASTYAAIGRLRVIEITGIEPDAQWPETRGAVIAVATLADCHFDQGMSCCDPWGMEGFFHWELTNVAALPEPVTAKGALGFWTPSADVMNAVTVQQTGVTW
ncbi:ASCH domain-containing protein [Streptomyces sp. NPDC048511]|uniref:ASCH domain-containing protein n=1 Tax=Streptomyces sp. NPDC048511 TaxID=3365562 RepID=UPI003714CA4A